VQFIPGPRGETPESLARRSGTAVALARSDPIRRDAPMLDLIFIAATIVFFGAAFAYAHACERL
jgi:hypothetical protein